MDKQRRINFYNFKRRQYKRQPYVVELNLFGKTVAFYFYPPGIDVCQKKYHYDNQNTWNSLLEDEPF